LGALVDVPGAVVAAVQDAARIGGGKNELPAGSSFDSWLREEGIYEETASVAIKRVLARQHRGRYEGRKCLKGREGLRMHTSRAPLDRLRDPENEGVTLSTLPKTASAVGREIRLELV
jgi:antitoxin HicB